MVAWWLAGVGFGVWCAVVVVARWVGRFGKGRGLLVEAFGCEVGGIDSWFRVTV